MGKRGMRSGRGQRGAPPPRPVYASSKGGASTIPPSRHVRDAVRRRAAEEASAALRDAVRQGRATDAVTYRPDEPGHAQVIDLKTEGDR